ncbi:response regulator [Larkinella soli]|uniref:response regulator n=1 Tax=Larkinella soli TaxID=1770527 RepID=UPI000FFC2A74|nr:response regulator [Larkinella soli]
MEVPLQIYLAEDDEDDAFLFQIMIKEHFPDSRISVFVNGKELMEALRSEGVAPTFIFLDINMPVMNGIEALTAIRSSPATRTIPTFILSSSDFGRDVEQSYLSGANAYFVKPNQLADFSRMIDNFKSYWNLAGMKQPLPAR